ncbi:MAG TPA: DUF2062 domain-containing protein [Xanthomonadaceae bacterium]|nr:DUF2062 domain-containing protein [Xanthomonadaceae bacterium]
MTEDLHRHRQGLKTRRRRLRVLLRRLPRRANVHRYPVIRWFAHLAGKAPFLWSYKHENVAPALYAGAVLAFLPLYGFQFVLAFGVALLFRANLTVTVGLQFITNPFTILPIYGFTGLVGSRLMTTVGFGEELPTALFYTNALFIGGVTVGLCVALVADLLWRFFAWEARRFRAQLKRLEVSALDEAWKNGSERP